MEEAIKGAWPFLLAIFGVWLIASHHVRINRALSISASELGLTFIPSWNIFKKKRMQGEIDGYKCEVLVYGRSAGRSRTTYLQFSAFFPNSVGDKSEPEPGAQHSSVAKETEESHGRQNQALIESARKKLKRLKVGEDHVSSTYTLFFKYYRSQEIVVTMREVLQLAKGLSRQS